MIKSVYGFAIGCYFVHDGNLFEVTSFPTRSMVCGKLVHKFMEPCPQTVKVYIRNVEEMEHLDWIIQDAREERKKWRKESKDYWAEHDGQRK